MALDPKVINDLKSWSLFGLRPKGEGARTLIDFFESEPASRPSLMEPIGVGISGKHLNGVHGPDGTLDPNRKDVSSLIEAKNESYTNSEPLQGRQSWGIKSTNDLTREENIKKKMKSFGVLQIGSFTEDFRLVALFDMPIEKTNVERDLIKIAKNKGTTLKICYKSLDTPEAIDNAFVNTVDLDLAEKYCTSGYLKFLKKLDKRSVEEF